MTIDTARGTKRTCTNDDCGQRFYDLNSETPVCPICASAFAIPPPVEESAPGRPQSGRWGSRSAPALAIVAPAKVSDDDDDDDLESVSDSDDEDVSGDDVDEDLLDSDAAAPIPIEKKNDSDE